VKLSSFGDIVHATPCLRALRLAYPGASLVMAVERRWRDVVAADPHLDGLVEVASYPHLSLACLADLRRALRASGVAPFDVAVDLQGTRRSAACVYLSGARVRYGRGGFRPGWRDAVRPVPGRHAVEVCADACRAGGVAVDDLAPRLYTSPGDELAVAAFLDASGLPRDGFVLVNPYSRNASKDLPDATALALLEGIARDPGVTVLVTSGADERDRADALARAARVATIAGRLPLAQALCMFRRARLMVSCDSGPLHAAAALGTPVVAVFGPTLPECTGPWGRGHVIVQAMRPATAFAYRDDPAGRYMAANEADSVVRAVRDALRRPLDAGTAPSR
jgi:ADP-heptose:LPS heptosyltransferase